MDIENSESFASGQLSPATLYSDIFSKRPTRAAAYVLSSRVTPVDYSDCQRILDFLESFPDHPLATQIERALAVVQRCFNEYPQMALSFNGGKDATLVLHLVRTYCLALSLAGGFSAHEIFCSRIVCFVLHTAPEFRELSDFFVWADENYNLRSHILQDRTFKGALEKFVTLTRLPMCFMGVRRGDPKSARVFMSPTPGWPAIWRVSPAWHFSFVDVFDFLLRFDFRYCELYNCGFTSLGDSETKAHAAITGASVGLRMREKLESRRIAAEDAVSEGRDCCAALTSAASGSPRAERVSDETVADALISRGITYERIIARFADENATPAYCISIEESEAERSGRPERREHAEIGRSENLL